MERVKKKKTRTTPSDEQEKGQVINSKEKKRKALSDKRENEKRQVTNIRKENVIC